MHSFKAAGAPEIGHDFLLRGSEQVPARGNIAIFSRSDYEEVTVGCASTRDAQHVRTSRAR